MPEGERGRLPRPVVYLLRSLGFGALVGVVILGSLYAFAGNWPPLTVLESGSMQHSNETSHLGVADTGDIVLVQRPSRPEDVVTYVEGRARGYMTYGDFGDAIVFQRPGDPRIVMHRPLFRLLWNETAQGFDIPSIQGLEKGVDWDANQETPFGLRAGGLVTLYNTGYNGTTVQVRFAFLIAEVVATRCVPENPCYVTMGDNNAPAYDHLLVRHSWVLGRARGEIPWLGLLKLVFDRTYGWGDSRVPSNSWALLAVVVSVLIGVPVAFEVTRSVRKQRRRGSEEADVGGLGGVVAVLEERWGRADKARAGKSEAREKRDSATEEPSQENRDS